MSETKEWPRRAIRSFVGNEALLIAVATALVYLFSYSFEKSYLSYFGIEGAFVSLGVSDLAFAATALSVFLVLVFQFTQLPIFWFRISIVRLIFVNILPLFVSMFFLLVMYYEGVTWTSVALLIVF